MPAGAFTVRAKLGSLESRVGEQLGHKDVPAEERRALIEDLRAFVRDTKATGEDERNVAEAALTGAFLAAGAKPPDQAAVLELTADFEKKYPKIDDFFGKALELRLRARVSQGDTAGAVADVDALVKAGGLDGERRKLLVQVGRDLATKSTRAEGEQATAARALARTVYTALVANGGTDAERIQLADLELSGGDPAAARKLYDEILAKNPTSNEAQRGAAKAAVAMGDRAGAIAYWRQVVESSTPGGTAWFEARVAQVQLLAEGGSKSQACELARGARGKSTSAGADQLSKRLSQLEAEVCK